MKKRISSFLLVLVMLLSLVPATVFAADGDAPNENIAVTAVTLDQSELTLEVGATETLTATVVPDDATDKTVAWTSSNEEVTTVADGVVTAVAAGEAIITATTTDGAFTATCAVTVNAPAPVVDCEKNGHTDSDANDFCDVCGSYIGTAATQTIPVKLIIPEGAEATFYTGSEGKGYPIAAEDLGVSESNAAFHNYEITVPDGTYSCMVADEDHNYGGVGFAVPLQTSIYEDTNLTLALVKYYTTTTSVKVNGVATPVSVDSVDDFRLNLVAPGKATIIPGENYIDNTIIAGKTYVVAPRMVWAYGNQILYNYTVDLNDELSADFGVKPQINATFASTITAVQKKTFSVAAIKTFTLTAPTAAKTTFFNQLNNYNNMVLGDGCVSSVDNGDGTTTYTVRYADFANASYRVEQTGYVTAAGYCKDNTAYTVTTDMAAVEADKANKTRTVFPFRADADGSLAASTAIDITSKAGAGSNIEYENSVYLNIDDTKDTNELAMKVGDTFRLRGFRAAWEIVNTVTANIMIEPDFHYAVLNGSDVVSVTPVTEQCSGNAGSNWMDIKALKEGTALIAVWYDAVDVGGNTTLSGTYGATDPARYGYVLVNVGEDHTVTFHPVSADGDWDAEFDTVYYYGDSGTLTIAPEGAKSVTVQNLNGTTVGKSVAVTAEDGKYNVPVKSGSNLISVTTADGTDYMLVRAKKISYTIENKTTGLTDKDDGFVIRQGDEICVHFDQFNMPVAKMSGIYNPGYMGTAMTVFNLNDQYKLTSVGTQYDYISDAKSCLTFTALVPGENVLSGGFIQSGSMGDRFGNHRNLTDVGRGTNFSAVNVTGQFGSIEDISFNVEKNSEATVDYDSLVGIKSISLYSGVDSYTTGFKFTAAKTTNYAVNWTQSNDAYMLSAKVTTASYYNTIEMKYWYDGEEAHTVALASGMETQVAAPDFHADKTKVLNIEIRITPGDPDLGPTKVYSYVVYPGNANLQYVHPILSDLTASANGETVQVVGKNGEGVFYTDTEYELLVGDASVISLSGTQLQKATNKTNNKQDNSDTVVVTKLSKGQPVGEGITVLPLTADKYPVGTWTLNDLDISDADALEITVTSYVDGTTSRTYHINFNHTVVTDAGVAATCTTEGLTEGSHCAVCGKVIVAQETIPATDHKSVTDKAVAATYTKTGKTEGSHCSVCHKVIKAQKTVAMRKLAQAKITSVTNVKSGITIKWGKITGANAYQVWRKIGSGEWKCIKTTTATSYTHTGLDNGSKCQYKVRAVAKLSGEVVNRGAFSTIKIMYRLTRPTLSSGTKNIATKSIVVKWNKNANATGYQVKVGTADAVTVKGAKTVSKTVSKLKKGSTYKVKVRSYKKVNGKTYYSAWSAVKSVKVTK